MERNIEFESIVGKDETGKAKLELGTDHLNGMRFSINYPSVKRLVSLFSIVDYFTMLKSASYERLLVDYKDWYANEIINRVTSDSSYYDKQSDAKKEVLSELVQRRNKLKNQINKAMSFYDENKSKIDKMQKIRSLQQKFYPGPMISFTGNALIFENVTEYFDIFYQLTLSVPEGEGENQPGYGWVEYSKAFSETFHNLRYLTDDVAVITNSKPRSDMRVMRRGDQNPSHQMNLGDTYYDFFRESAAILELCDADVGRQVNFNQPQVFTMVDLVKNQLSENTKISVRVESDLRSEFSVKIDQGRMIITIPEPDFVPLQFTLNTSTLLSFTSIIHLVDSLSITKLGFNLGMVLDLELGSDHLRIINTSDTSSQATYLRKVFWNYLMKNALNESLQLPSKVLEGGTQRTIDGNYYTREITKYEIDISYRERKAHILLQELIDKFSATSELLKFEGNEISTSLKLSNGTPVKWQCTCGTVNDYFKCEHLLACFIYGYKEGVLFA